MEIGEWLRITLAALAPVAVYRIAGMERRIFARELCKELNKSKIGDVATLEEFAKKKNLYFVHDLSNYYKKNDIEKSLKVTFRKKMDSHKDLELYHLRTKKGVWKHVRKLFW